MPLSAQIRYPQVDLKKTQQEIHRVMTEFITEALKTWVVTTTDHVPVWTGASKATFTKLATAAGYELTIAPVAPVDRREFGDAHGYGRLQVDQANGLYGWFYSSDLEYIHIVDARHNFLAAGQQVLAALTTPTLPVPEIETR